MPSCFAFRIIKKKKKRQIIITTYFQSAKILVSRGRSGHCRREGREGVKLLPLIFSSRGGGKNKIKGKKTDENQLKEEFD